MILAMNGSDILARRREEFEKHVWNHAEDEFQLAFDQRAFLTTERVESLVAVIHSLRNNNDLNAISNSLRDALSSDPTRIMIFLQLIGLTRNKIIQDLQGSTANTGIKIPGKPENLYKKDDVWAIAGQYMAQRIHTVLSPLGDIDDEALPAALEALNQATWPGWIRQERAKRQGHEAEYRIAVMLASLSVPFVPTEKSENPLCRDAQLDDISYDLIVPDAINPMLCIKSTVHTANIGQYGESKDALEIKEAAKSLASRYPTPVLLAMVDGVGFRSNRAGLDGVLLGADEFCQFKTIWKVAVVALHVIGARAEISLPDLDEHSGFLSRYSQGLGQGSAHDTVGPWVTAGEGHIRRIF